MNRVVLTFERIVIYSLMVICLVNCNGDAKNRNSDFNSRYVDSSFTFNSLSVKTVEQYKLQVKEFYDSALLSKGFNGAILVAKNGQVLFEDYHGLINFQTNDSITANTPFHLASISKTFTGMAILKFWEQGKISLEDSLQKFFPQFPYQGVTIRMLLSHRSGLPNYLYFMDSIWNKHQKVTNQDVLNSIIIHKPPLTSMPGTHFNYSNTNFVLLALIIEKLSGKQFPQYMKQNVFEPLGMMNTYIFSSADTVHYVPTYSVTKPFPMDQYDCTYGDKNVYSTPQDLLRWDKALYQHTFVSKATLDTAFTPLSMETPSMHNYGLAWRLFINKNDTLVYHNGNWHGSNTVFARFIQDTATIIVLSNKQNKTVYEAKKIGYIFSGRNFTGELKE